MFGEFLTRLLVQQPRVSLVRESVQESRTDRLLSGGSRGEFQELYGIYGI